MAGPSPATEPSIRHSPDTGDLAVSIARLIAAGNGRFPSPRTRDDQSLRTSDSGAMIATSAVR
jgi:hypothetical protein